MELQLKVRKKSPVSITERITVPVSADMKQQLHDLKNHIDVNDAARTFFNALLEKHRNGQLQVD